jgi:hypothetical protein
MGKHSRTVLSVDDLLRPLRAKLVRDVLREHKSAKLVKSTYYSEWMSMLGVNRQELDNILSAVMELDIGFGTFMHASLVVNPETGKPGKGYYKQLQQFAERVAQAQEKVS